MLAHANAAGPHQRVRRTSRDEDTITTRMSNAASADGDEDGAAETLLLIRLALLPTAFNYVCPFQVRQAGFKKQPRPLCARIVSVGLCTWGAERRA